MIDLLYLTADQRAVLNAIALHDLPVGQTKIVSLFQVHTLTAADGTAFSAERVKTCIASLGKFVQFQASHGYVLSVEARMTVLLALQQDGQLQAWAESLRTMLKAKQEYGSWKYYTPQFCQREMFLSAVLGENNAVEVWQQRCQALHSAWQTPLGAVFFAHRDGIILFATLNDYAQAAYLIDVFIEANFSLSDCGAAYNHATARVEQIARHLPALIEQLCWQALLRGDLAQLKTLQQYAPNHFQTESAIGLSVISGDFFLAIDMAEILIKAWRAKSGKRKILVPTLLGLLYTVALLGKNDAASLKRAITQAEEGSKQQHAYSYFVLLPLLHHLASGVPLKKMPASANKPANVDTLFEALAHYWRDCPRDESLHSRLLQLRDEAGQRGYAWVAAEADSLLHSGYGDTALMPAWHATQKLKPLMVALPREETWQRALTALAKIKTGSVSPTQGSDVRIVWQIDANEYGVEVNPVEQKRSAKGVWSKGRAIALKRFVHEPESLTGLTEQDRRIATCIENDYDRYYGGDSYQLDGEKALPLLIGHPHVYWIGAPEVRIDVLKGEVALLLQERGDKISLKLDPNLDVDHLAFWRKETPTRLLVYATSAEVKQIAGILGHGLSVPSNAKAQLVDVIAAIAPHLPIHSDLPELAEHITVIDADTILYVHLLPLQEGLRLQFLLRPLPDGSWLTPGKGSANVLGEQGGVAVQAKRNLKSESKFLADVIDACPAFAEAEENGQEWELSHPELCLELLSQLKALPAETLQLVWPEGERFRLKGSRTLQQMKLNIRRQGEWFMASGEITLDDGRVMALRELMQLTEGATGRFLKLGENDYLALTESFRKRLDELRILGETVGKDGLRINPLAAPTLAELAAEVGELKADRAWREHVQKLDTLADFIPALPSTLQAELRDYQLTGYQWLARLAHWGVGACLADDMGLGKTVQALALLLDRAPRGPALVVAPISVAMNWQDEVARFAPTLRVRNYHNNRNLAALGAFDVVIASYGMLQSDSEMFSAEHWHSVVLDEAQVIKNSATKRSQAAMALTADFKMIATGTPMENHLGELWNLFRFINPGLLGSQERFNERFSNPIERGDKAARQHLKKLIQPFILRRTKTQVLKELPSRTEITLQVVLSEEERHLYEALRQESIDKIAHMKPGESKALQVLTEITKLRRFCCNPQLVMKSASVNGSKLAVFANVVEELLENRHKALVFSQFVDHLSIVRAWLDAKGIFYQYLDGSTPAQERKKRVDAFQAGQGDIFLISLKAGGTGLNLTAADYVLHLDPWWNPAVEDQASDRAHRIGQQRPVTIYRLVSQDTIEEKIIALHAQKRDLADSLLDGGDAAGRMDTAALLKLLKESV